MTESSTQHNAFIRWRHTAAGRLCWAVLAGVITYVFASFAINSGSLLQWFVAVVFLVDCIYNLVQLARKVIHGRQS